MQRRKVTRNRWLHSCQFSAISNAVRNIPSCDDYHIVVLIESSFRPLLFRLAEYAYLVLLLIVHSPRVSSLTIGRNQLRYDHWLDHLKSINHDERLISVLRSCERIRDSRAATKWFLDWRGFRDGTSNQSVSKLYTGSRNPYYDGLFSESRKLLRKGLSDCKTPGRDGFYSSGPFLKARGPFLRVFFWLSTFPFFITAWFCFKINLLSVRNDLALCRSILRKHAHQEISDELYDVLRLAEDHRNALHFGVDPIAICRSVWRNLMQNSYEGASTIEQQFVRSCTGRYERTLKRKFREQMVAVRLKQFATKREINTAFIFTVHFGDLHRGPLAILRKSGRLPSSATFLDSAHLIARIKFPEPSPITAQWMDHFDTRVGYLLLLVGAQKVPAVLRFSPHLSLK